MKTDISIDDFLALGPEAFRILAGGRELQGPYRFRSETLKNIERRIDGLCDPGYAPCSSANRATLSSPCSRR